MLVDTIPKRRQHVHRRTLTLKTLRVVALSEVPLETALPPNFKFRQIPEDELVALIQISEYGISPVLLEDIRGHRENRCYGIYDSERLAHYLFIFVTPTLMADDLEVLYGLSFTLNEAYIESRAAALMPGAGSLMMFEQVVLDIRPELFQNEGKPVEADLHP